MDTPALTVKQMKLTWLIIWAAICVSVLIYGLVCFMMLSSPQRQMLRGPQPAFEYTMYAVAVATLIAASVWAYRSTAAVSQRAMQAAHEKTPLPNPGEFQTNSIIALTLSEACSIYGLMLFFMGMPISKFAVFAAGTLLVNIAVILPRGLAYWVAWEEEQKPKSDSPFSGF